MTGFSQYDFGDFPDAELMGVLILQAADLGSFTPHIGTRLRDAEDFTKGAVVVTRAGGAPAERIRIDRPRIQVDVWHVDKQDARDLADICRRRLFEAEGQIIQDADSNDIGFLAGVDVDTGMTWIFDPLSLRPRYMFAVRLTTHQIDS